MSRMTTMADALRQAIREGGQPLSKISRASGVPLPRLWLFATGRQAGLSLHNAEKLATYLGLELSSTARVP